MIVAILPPKLAEGLRRAEIPHAHRLSVAYQAASEAPFATGDLVIIDPLSVGADVHLIERLAASIMTSGARCAFYTEFSAAHMHAVGAAAALAPLALWIAGVDDASPEFRLRVLRLAGHQIVLNTLEMLRPAIEQLPWRLGSAVVTLFAEPERFFDARDLERTAGLSRRSVDRQLVDTGFVTASRLIVAAKLLHAAARLQCGGTTVLEVASSLGYSAHEVLGRQCQRVLGCRPSALATYPADALCFAIAAFICPSAVASVKIDTTPSQQPHSPGAPYSYAWR
ncbi:MAG TPA: AraC family transcriptional regulator [Gemmatimonadaceae bacterium]